MHFDVPASTCRVTGTCRYLRSGSGKSGSGFPRENEVKDITDWVQQSLKDRFSSSWSSVIDAAGREDDEEDPFATLTRTYDKAVEVLSLSVEELSILLKDQPQAFVSPQVDIPLRSMSPKTGRARTNSTNADLCEVVASKNRVRFTTPQRLPSSLHEAGPIAGVADAPALSSPMDAWVPSEGAEYPEAPLDHTQTDENMNVNMAQDGQEAERGNELQQQVGEAEDKAIGDATAVSRRSKRSRLTKSYQYQRADGDSVVESDSGEDDDYQRTVEEERKKEESRRRRKGLSPLPPDNEDEDEDDDELEDPPIHSGKRHYGEGTKKSRKRDETRPKTGDEDGERKKGHEGGGSKKSEGTKATIDDPEDSDEETLGGKPGVVDAATRAEAQRNLEEYEAKQEALARAAGKPVSAIYRVAGDSRRRLRGWNLWNLWQKWLVHEEGGQMQGEKPNEEAFHWLVEWYEPLYEADARPLIQKGLTKRQIEKVAQEFNSNSRHANRNLGVCCFGFIVDLYGDHSVMFGAGKEFEDMRARSHSQLSQYLTDVVAMLRNSSVNIRLGVDANSDHRWITAQAASIPLNSGKDAHRSFIPLVMRYDLSRFAPNEAWKKGKFKWNDFADLAFRHQARIINWHKLVGVPGTTLREFKNTVPMPIIYEMTGPRLKELHQHASRYENGDDEVDILKEVDKNALRLVEWSQAEKELPLELQGEIPIVVATDGKTLTRVKNSKQWALQASSDTEDPKRKRKSKAKQKSLPSRSPSPSCSRSKSPIGSPAQVPNQEPFRARSDSPLGSPSRGRSDHRSNVSGPNPPSHSTSLTRGDRVQSPTGAHDDSRSNSNGGSRGDINMDDMVWDDTVQDLVHKDTLGIAETPVPTPKYGVIKPKKTGGHKRKREHSRQPTSGSDSASESERLPKKKRLDKDQDRTQVIGRDKEEREDRKRRKEKRRRDKREKEERKRERREKKEKEREREQREEREKSKERSGKKNGKDSEKRRERRGEKGSEERRSGKDSKERGERRNGKKKIVSDDRKNRNKERDSEQTMKAGGEKSRVGDGTNVGGGEKGRDEKNIRPGKDQKDKGKGKEVVKS
ncbi:hypothetical protein K435DRAFT_793253 [Dendrothele bispora CBS 962.96]|uniref:Uncharacterized protein n=1 Tax=Dendrothele bispora (strain CBS 962.96) TaxID=1314807 RepID=A0A4S8MGD6_DENBC|nr:hypothetical protein K435DRAFT_793253 [Dendrothele bispora CBS 962.96]